MIVERVSLRIEKAMARFLWILTIFLVVVTLAQSAIDATKKICPKPQFVECAPGVKSTTHYAYIRSNHFDANFLCDTKTDGGGWIVIQRRVYKSTSFFQSWEAYKHGFGKVCGDYWLGNEKIYEITKSGGYELMIDMVYNSTSYFAHYKNFKIGPEGQNYRLRLSPINNGTVRNSLTAHNNKQFSTPDMDNDRLHRKHCGKMFQSGWWYHNCIQVNLNGQFDHKGYRRGVIWQSLTGDYRSLSSVEMKIRSVPTTQQKIPRDLGM